MSTQSPHNSNTTAVSAVDHEAAAADDGTLVQDEAGRARSRELSRQASAVPGNVPGYEILHCLGEGSFGSVWLARESNTGKQVAIKFYSHRRGLDWSLLSREVEKLAVLYTSRNVVGLLDVGWDHDPPFFVMEYLQQGSLAARLASGPLPVDDAVQITKAVAGALVEAHGSGILHCDVKPANVLMGGNDEPRLADFGQSRLSDDQSPALGTLFYMAPEQADLHAVPDARWDVYALGALLYHMLVGRPPYRTDDASTRLDSETSLPKRLDAYRELIAASPRPDAHRKVPCVDKKLAEIVDRCLHRDPARRYPNTQVVLDALEAREEARAKRPLILLGFLGPLLFLLAMYWIAARGAIPEAVRIANQNQIALAMARDEVAARLLAGSVEKELEIRLDELERLAEDPALREFLRESETRPVSEWPNVTSPMDKWFDDAQLRLAAQDRTEDDSWFLCNSQGDQVTRRPREKTIGKNFRWRSYFHGGTKEYDEEDIPPGTSIRMTPGVSTAFRSDATREYMVALAVPVWDEDHVEVIGLMARTIHLPKLLSQWEQRISGEVPPATRFLALVDTRKDAGFLLDHEWMTEQNVEGRTGEQIREELRLDEATLQAVPHQRQFTDYRDPVGDIDAQYDIEWLAVFAPVEDTGGWYAIVQESREEALRPVGELNDVFWDYGLSALAVFSVMLVILWYLIHRAAT
jgi:eukaryotic-like serine/threonine-protein kinase